MKYYYLLSILSFCYSASNQAPSHVPTHVVKVTGPNKTKVGVPIQLSVSFWVHNGCGRLDTFIQNKDTIEVYADYTKGNGCTDAFKYIKADYTFVRNKPGRYILYFRKSERQEPQAIKKRDRSNQAIATHDVPQKELFIRDTIWVSK